MVIRLLKIRAELAQKWQRSWREEDLTWVEIWVVSSHWVQRLWPQALVPWNWAENPPGDMCSHEPYNPLCFQMRLMNKPCSDCIYSDLNIERLFYFNVIAISISEDDRRCIGINIADKWMSCDDNLEHPEHDWALIRRLCWHWKRSVTPKKV